MEATKEEFAALMYAAFQVLRDENGPKWCRKKFMGPLRQRLEISAAQSTIEGVAAAEATHGAAGIAAKACKSCRQCELGRG